MVLFSFLGVSELAQGRWKTEIATPERSEGVLLSTARRDIGFSNPSTPNLMKALSQDGAFFVSGGFEFTQTRTERKITHVMLNPN